MRKILLYALPVILCVSAPLFCGCEKSTDTDSSGADDYFNANPYESEPRDEPSSSDIKIVPVMAAVDIYNQEVVFSASGGSGSYSWHLSNEDNGEINSDGGNQCVYICKKVGNNTLTVQDDDGHYATAQITPVTDDMSITPSSVTLVSGTLNASFKVSGGTPPYVWTSGNVRLGTVSYSSGSSDICAYIAVAGSYGVNMITVRDDEGRTASAQVTQSQ